MMPDIRTDVADQNRRINQNAAERAITNIYLHDVDANIGQVISELWAEEKHFRKKTGMYSEQYQLNTPDFDKVN